MRYGNRHYIPDEYDLDDILEQLEVEFAKILRHHTGKQVREMAITLKDRNEEYTPDPDWQQSAEPLTRADFGLPNIISVTYYLIENEEEHDYLRGEILTLRRGRKLRRKMRGNA